MEYHHESEIFEVYCLRHRPFPLVKEIQKNEKLTEDEVIHFSELFDNSLFEYKNLKRWTERDRRELLQKVQKAYFQMRKLKITLYKGPEETMKYENCTENKESYHVRNGRYFAQPKEWSISLSRTDFPWKICRFKNYNSRDCHAMFIEMI
jgi:hypothetical protein